MTLRIEDLITEVSRKTTSPESIGIEYSVRGEDFDTDSLRFRRKSTLEEAGATFYRHFLPGEILYMTRNPRLRKVAEADFEGIAANTTLVLTEKETLSVQPGIVKFILSSDKFHEYAKSVQVGSTNPFTKWKDLKRFEVKLPSLKRQQELLDILNLIEINLKLLDEARLKVDRFYKVYSLNYFKSDKRKFVAISELLEFPPESGYSPNEHHEETGLYVLNLGCLTKTGYQHSRLKPILKTDYESGKVINEGDFLISRSNTAELVGLCGIYSSSEEKVIFPDTMWRLHFKQNTDPKLVMHYLLSPEGRRSIQRVAAGTSGSMKKINKASFSKIRVPLEVPEIDNEYCKFAANALSLSRISHQKYNDLIHLRKKIVEELVG